jgi:SH3-like domain-containing protein
VVLGTGRDFIMDKHLKLAAFISVALVASAGLAQSTKKPPYWASIDEAEARMRTGPSTEFPVKWVYKRHHLPVKVVAVHEVWRKIEDPDGDQGWMHVRLLSPNRTALVIGSGVGALRDAPQPTSRIAWRVEPGVVGRVDECDKDWCRFDVSGRSGYIEADRLWGDEALEGK